MQNQMTEPTDALEAFFGPPIYSYTRAQALADGVLVDMDHATDDDGKKLSPFIFPVAMTRAAYAETIEAGGRWDFDPADPESEILILPAGQNVTGRLWDLFTMLRHAIRPNRPGERLPFSVLIDTHGNGRPHLVRLRAVCGPGDNYEPVITIMLPTED